MKPLVSILIPCYNAAPWLAETLESALAQTWENKEIIVVDDGSTDRSLAIAQSFELQGIKVISQLNKGASAARNRALKEAKGDFIQYLDADDLLAPDKIELQLELFSTEESLDCVASSEWARFYKMSTEAQFLPQPLWADMSPVDWLVCALENHWMMHPAAWLVPRSIAHKTGLWKECLSLNDDGEYFCRVVLASKEVKFCWGARTYYRSGNSSSLSGAKSHAGSQSAFRSLELETNHLLAKEDSLRTRHACATGFQRFIYETYPGAPDLLRQAETKIQQLGGTDLKPAGGSLFQLATNIFGWKRTKNLQRFMYRYGYKRAAVGFILYL